MSNLSNTYLKYIVYILLGISHRKMVDHFQFWSSKFIDKAV